VKNFNGIYRFKVPTAAEKEAAQAAKETPEMQKDEQIAVVEQLTTEQIETENTVVVQPKKTRKPVSEFRKLTSKLDAKVRIREKNLAKIEQLKKSVVADQIEIDRLLVEINALQNKT